MDTSVMSGSGEHASEVGRAEGGLCSPRASCCPGQRDEKIAQTHGQSSEQCHTGQRAETSQQRQVVPESRAAVVSRGNPSPARNEDVKMQKSLREMDSEEVARWVRQVLTQADSPSVRPCLEGAVQAFRANMVTGVDVLELTSEDLREELGISTLAVRKALMQAIRVHLAR